MTYKEIIINEIPCLIFLKGRRRVLYVGPDLNWFQKRRIKSSKIPVSVTYLPDLLGKPSKEVLSYNFPGIDFPNGFSAETIYSEIRAVLGDKVQPDSRLILKYDYDKVVVFDAGSNFKLLLSYLKDRCRDFNLYIEHYNSGETGNTLFRKKDFIEDRRTTLFRKEFREDPIDKDKRLRKEAWEASFSAEMRNAALEAKSAMQKIILDGFPVEIIKSWLNESVKLSRLRITKQYKIILVDYNGEIEMGPLPKTVFLFYLRHPEGVAFPYLQDHKKELEYIYSKLSAYDDPRKISKSIENLVSPFSNSINEKCAAIKKAFILKISDEIAENYYVAGVQGEKKGIKLDRSLVEWECEL